MRRFILRWLNVLRRRRADEELDREVTSHLTLLEDEHVRRGLTPDEARLAARRAMGSVALVKDRHRDARSFVWLDDARLDLRFAARMLVRRPLLRAWNEDALCKLKGQRSKLASKWQVHRTGRTRSGRPSAS